MLEKQYCLVREEVSKENAIPTRCHWNAEPQLFACVVSVKGPRNFVFGFLNCL